MQSSSRSVNKIQRWSIQNETLPMLNLPVRLTVKLMYFYWTRSVKTTLSIRSRCLPHFYCGKLTCRLSFNCGISILNLWTGSKSCCWLNWCCCCCSEVGCCRPGWAIGPPGCCWEAILAECENNPEEDGLNIRFSFLFQNKKLLYWYFSAFPIARKCKCECVWFFASKCQACDEFIQGVPSLRPK